ncbi:MAG: hypothetical protein M0002_18830 [Rhodospirillales bacterium]|nr:hypothetical protein [Rhodospirillales bacterium]
MTAREALAAARATGIRMRPDGSRLILEADTEPPPEVVHLLAQHKAEIIAILAAKPDPAPTTGPRVLHWRCTRCEAARARAGQPSRIA